MSNDQHLRFPIGPFAPKESYTQAEITDAIARIESLPQRIEAVAKTLSARQLDTTYRDGGWTARQVIHHVADSHLNAYIRIKWTLTEETPMIKAYDEKLWATTPEVKLDPAISLNLLTSLHAKFAALLKSIPAAAHSRSFIHPETNKQVSIERMIALYAWHGDHHLGHLKIVAAK